MKLVVYQDLAGMLRYCCACRTQHDAGTMSIDLHDLERRTAWYCPACVRSGQANLEAKSRKKQFAHKAATRLPDPTYKDE